MHASSAVRNIVMGDHVIVREGNGQAIVPCIRSIVEGDDVAVGMVENQSTSTASHIIL